MPPVMSDWSEVPVIVANAELVANANRSEGNQYARVSCHCGAVLGELVLVEGYQRCDNDVVLVVMDGVTLRTGVRVMVKGGGAGVFLSYLGVVTP